MRLFDPGLLLAVGIAIAIAFGSMLLPVLIMLILPSRKGSMRTVRPVKMTGTVQAVWETMVSRFEFEEFEVDRTQQPHGFTAKRPARNYKVGDDELVTHATKGLASHVTFTPVPEGVDVQVALWMQDFVLLDSGEGRQIDAMLDRLVADDLEHSPSPVTASLSFAAIIALSAGVLALVLASLPLMRNWPSERHMLGYGIGIGVGGFYAIAVARQSLAAIRAKPMEVTGLKTVLAAIALGGLAIAAGAGWAVVGVLARTRTS